MSTERVRRLFVAAVTAAGDESIDARRVLEQVNDGGRLAREIEDLELQVGFSFLEIQLLERLQRWADLSAAIRNHFALRPSLEPHVKAALLLQLGAAEESENNLQAARIVYEEACDIAKGNRRIERLALNAIKRVEKKV